MSISIAETELTEDRAGDVDIGPFRVECPYCETEGVTDNEVNMCGSCGKWFRVIREQEDATS
jgi:hypothetical protein